MMLENHKISESSILNEKPVQIQGPSLLHDLVAAPSDTIALEFLENGSNKRKFSYRDLHILSDHVAGQINKILAELEIVPAIIPILLPQSPELYITLLAVLKAGKAFCPLNLDSPPERLRFILEDVSAGLIMTSSEYMKNADIPNGIEILVVDELLALTTHYDLYGPSNTASTNLAYVLYTSGSTGLPKAVGVSHRAATQSLLAHDRHIPRFSRFLQFASPTFDVSIFEIFFPWHRSSTLVGCERTYMLSDLPKTISMLEADAVELTPTVVSNLLTGRSSVPGLRLLLTIGEMLTESIIAEYGASENQNSMLWGMYGPTEAAIHCTIHSAIAASSSKHNIGRPLDTVSAFIAAPLATGEDYSTLHILPKDEEGELVLGGLQIAEGYLNRPELTASSFFEHPDHGCLYRTGDKARIRRDGALECFGRLSTGQVKLRGQRVEVGEIEQTILRLQGCRASAVMVLDGVLVAFCAHGSADMTRAAVLDMCRQWLPSFMVPSQVFLMESIPQLSSGKIDKNMLELLFHESNCRLQDESILDASDDHIMVQLLRQQLGRGIDHNTDLSSVGLDSLHAIKFATQLRERGFDVSATSVLSASNLSELIETAQHLQHDQFLENKETALAGALSPHELTGLADSKELIARVQTCTPLQEAMLAETIARPRAYCNWIEVELSTCYSYDEIKNALRALTRANEILRSGFHVSLSYTRRFIHLVWKSLHPGQIQKVDRFSKEYSMATQEDLLRPFTVQVQLGFGITRLLFQIHHALYDGWSFDLMMRDLELYLRDPGCTLLLRPQFVDVSYYHHNVSLEELQHHRAYWTGYLSDYTTFTLPNYNGQVVDTTSTFRLTRRSQLDVPALTACSRSVNVGPQVFYQTALAFVLSLYANAHDVLMGNVTSGRTLPITGIEDIIGPCVAALPFRLRLDGDASIRETLQETQHSNRAAQEHCSLSLRDITKAANVLPGSRLFDVLFVWQQAFSTSMDSKSCIQIVESADELEFKLTLEFEPRSDHIFTYATFDSSTIPKSQVEQLFQQIDDVVHYFVHHLDRSIASTKASFSSQCLSIANPQPTQDPIDRGLSKAVEYWAAISPEKIAIIFGALEDDHMEVQTEVTYAVLNRRANQLAHCLLQKGATPDSVVAIIMEKSIDLYVAILATLKTGSGYLPLAPDLPVERIKTILIDAEVAICVKDSSTRDLSPTLPTITSIDVHQIDLSVYQYGNLDVPYDGSRLAYAVFTSGSTGVPKGVLVTQDNLMSNLEYLASIYPASADSRLLQSCSQAFDVSVFEIFFTWHIGMALCTSRKDDLFRDLKQAINALNITHLSLTPTVAALIDPDDVPSVEFLVTAGEAVTEQVRRKWAGRGLWQGKLQSNVYVSFELMT